MALEIFLCLAFFAYVSFSLKVYISFKNSGLLQGGENTTRYYLYVFFWPLYINPFKLLAEMLFKSYGDKGHTYIGWEGFLNVYNDIIKGKARYNKYSQFIFNLELPESPEPMFPKLKFASISIAIKGSIILYICHLSESPFQDETTSIYDFDKCQPIDHQQLINKLQTIKVSYRDIEKITNTINQKALNND